MEDFPSSVRLEDRDCPLGCTRDDEYLLTGRDRLHDIPGRFNLVRCRGCGLMRTNPRPSAETIGVYYPNDYAPYLSTGIDGTPQANGRISPLKRRLRSWLGLEARQIPEIKPGSLLEIGCASGSYLERARAGGWQVEGVEFSEAAANQTRLRGIPVQAGSVESARPPSQAVDVIAAWMVLEHLHEPIIVLRRLRSWVKDGGYLIGSIPVHGRLGLSVFGDASYDLHLPAHLYHFSVKTLRLVLARAGWRVEHITWQRNPNTLLWSLEYLASDRGLKRMAALVRFLRMSPRVSKIRILLGVLLGATRQSGRIEFKARRDAELEAVGKTSIQ